MAKERDNKGRFVKGTSGNPAKRFSAGVAEEMQRRSVESRLANKRGAELIQAMLERGVKDPVVVAAMEKAGYSPEEITNELALHARQIEKAQKTGDTRAYAALMKYAGYDVLNIKTDGPQVLVVSEASIKAAEKWNK